MNISCISNEKDFFSFKEDWNELFQKNKNNTCFQSWEFNYEWWENNKSIGRLNILYIKQKNKTVFILPLYIDHKKHSRFLQAGSVDYLDALYNENDSDIIFYIKSFSEYIIKNKKIHAFTLNNLKKESKIISILPYFYKKKKYCLMQNDVFTFIDKERFDSKRYLNNIKSSRYNGLKKVDQTIQTEFEIFDIDKHGFPTEIINTLLRKMVENGIRESTIYERQLEFMKKLYQKNQIFFIAQRLKNDYISISCLVRLKDTRVMVWMDIYNPTIKNVNIKNYINIIKFCQKNNFDFDMGTGAYPYKIRNFSPSLDSLFTFYFYKNTYTFIYYFFRKIVAKVLGKV